MRLPPKLSLRVGIWASLPHLQKPPAHGTASVPVTSHLPRSRSKAGHGWAAMRNGKRQQRHGAVPARPGLHGHGFARVLCRCKPADFSTSGRSASPAGNRRDGGEHWDENSWQLVYLTASTHITKPQIRKSASGFIARLISTETKLSFQGCLSL